MADGNAARIGGVPCLLVPPEIAKRVLGLLRDSQWHPSHHSRLLLAPADPRSSARAYQISDPAAGELEAALTGQPPSDELKAELFRLVQAGAVQYDPFFRLEQCILALPLAPPEAASTAPAHGFTFIELFAGIGGFRVGLEQLAGRCVLASEINPWARAIYTHNFGEAVAGSIQSLQDVPKHQLLTAGFPCQPYTEQSGDRPRGFRDPRGLLFWHIIRIVRARSPRAVMLENVPGLLKTDVRRRREPSTGDGQLHAGSGLHVMVAALKESGYAVRWRLINAAGLVPQDRERLFIVGIRDDLDVGSFEWPEVPDSGCKLSDILQSADEADLEPHRLPTDLWQQVSSSDYFQRNPAHRLPALNGPSNTLRSSYKDGAKLYSQFVPLEDVEQSDSSEPPQCPYRFFTPRECARLQGFPDSFSLGAGAPEASVYHAIGNAVAPPVVTLIAKALLPFLIDQG